MPSLMYLVGATLTIIVSAFTGSYLGAYMKRKGENRAMHEDLKKIREQTAVLTKTTEDIKAQISDAMWHRQRQWEIRRDTIFEVAKQLGEVQFKLAGLVVAAFILDGADQTRRETAIADKRRAADDYHNAFSELTKAVGIAMLVCGPDVRHELRNHQEFVMKLVLGISQNQPVDPTKITREMNEVLNQVTSAIRCELGIDPVPAVPKSQSSGPPEVQGPGSQALTARV